MCIFKVLEEALHLHPPAGAGAARESPPAGMNRCSKLSVVYSIIDYSKLHETASAAYRCATELLA